MQLIITMDVDMTAAEDPARLISTLQDGVTAYVTGVAGVSSASVTSSSADPADTPATDTL